MRVRRCGCECDVRACFLFSSCLAHKKVKQGITRNSEQLPKKRVTFAHANLHINANTFVHVSCSAHVLTLQNKLPRRNCKEQGELRTTRQPHVVIAPQPPLLCSTGNYYKKTRRKIAFPRRDQQPRTDMLRQAFGGPLVLRNEGDRAKTRNLLASMKRHAKGNDEQWTHPNRTCYVQTKDLARLNPGKWVNDFVCF